MNSRHMKQQLFDSARVAIGHPRQAPGDPAWPAKGDRHRGKGHLGAAVVFEACRVAERWEQRVSYVGFLATIGRSVRPRRKSGLCHKLPSAVLKEESGRTCLWRMIITIGMKVTLSKVHYEPN